MNDYKAKTELNTSETVKKTVAYIVDVLDSIEVKKFPSLKKDVVELRKSVASIQDNVTIELQKNKINTFFTKAANILFWHGPLKPKKMTKEKKHLYYLNELSDYKISKGYPDVRGWHVRDRDNRVIGTVNNLLVSTKAEKVVYLDVEVNKSIIDANHDPYGHPTNDQVREFINEVGENHIIIPIGLVELHEDEKYVFTDTINHQTFSETKRIRKGSDVKRDYEEQVLNSYDRNPESDNLGKSTTTEKKTRLDDQPQGEAKIRRIVRDEIRRHKNRDQKASKKGSGQENHVFDAEDLEIDIANRRRNVDVFDDDKFYERKEFDDRRFKKLNT